MEADKTPQDGQIELLSLYLGGNLGIYRSWFTDFEVHYYLAA